MDESRSNLPEDSPIEPGMDENPDTEGTPEKSAIEREQERLQRAIQESQSPIAPTHELDYDERHAIPDLFGLAFGTSLGSASHYLTLPLHLARADHPPVLRWRIELHDLSPGAGPLGLDIVGDTTLGRSGGGTQGPDLDMDAYGAFDQGVSRRHALLRPTANHLYIIDLNSTNGTMHNAVPLGPGVARSLRHNDTITLGQLSFTVKIIAGPGQQVREVGEEKDVAIGSPTKPLPKDEEVDDHRGETDSPSTDEE